MKNLTPNSTYKFAIRAYKTANGKEVLSPSFPVVTAETMSLPVTNLSVSLSEERAYLTWSASKGTAGYYIYYNAGSGWVEYGSTTNTAFRKKQLQPATEYTFGVKTYKTVNGKRFISKDITTVKSCTAPVVPSYTFTKKNSVYTLTWQAVSGADEYIVYSQVPGQSWERKAVTAKTEVSFTQADAPSLYLAVRAVKKVGGQKYVSDYWKKLSSDKKPAGTLYTFGDSIAKGTGSHRYTYAEMFAEEHSLDIFRQTISGGSLCSALDANHICQDVIDCIASGSNYTYIMIEGGRNDYYYNCPLGEITPNGTSSFDMNTVCGAMEAALWHIRENSPNSKVIFVMMHNAAGQREKENALGLTFADYADAIEKVCEKYGAAVADCLNAGLDTGDAAISKKYTYHYFDVYPNGDTVHPSETAYRIFYLPQIEEAAANAKPISAGLATTETQPPTEPEPAEEPTASTEPTAPTTSGAAEDTADIPSFDEPSSSAADSPVSFEQTETASSPSSADAETTG